MQNFRLKYFCLPCLELIVEKKTNKNNNVCIRVTVTYTACCLSCRHTAEHPLSLQKYLGFERDVK